MKLHAANSDLLSRINASPVLDYKIAHHIENPQYAAAPKLPSEGEPRDG